MRHYKSSQQRQQGAILFLALIMLLLITVIGTSSIGLTTLDTRMTSNARDQQSAFQTAEYGLVAAESILAPSLPLPRAGTTPGHIENLTSEWWSDPLMWSNGVAVVNGVLSTTYITDVPFEGAIDSGEIVKDISLDNNRHVRLFYYTSTSRGIGPGGAPALLQSVFVRKTEGSELAE